ncbi:MAG: MlaD family protein [Endomicrobiia bacterium]
MKKETKLGLFVMLGIIAFIISVMTIKSIRLEKGYRLNVYFNEVAGLLEKAWVRVSGVKVGRVEKILLEGKKAKVIIWVKDDVKIHKDAEAKIVSTGLLGVKYLELTLGSDSQPLLKDGDSVVGIDPVSIDKILADGLGGLQNLSEALETFTGKGKLAENLNESLRNIREVTHKLNKNLTDEKISNFIDDITEAART